MTREELEEMAWDEPHVAAEWIIQLREALEIAVADGPKGYLEWIESAEDVLKKKHGDVSNDFFNREQENTQ